MSDAPLCTVNSTRGKLALTATILASAMVFLDTTVVTIALPKIQGEFGGGFAGLQWIADAYFVTLTAFLLLGGSFGDLFGRRRAFVVGLIGFSIGSVACGAAPTLGVLILARALQGIGGALLVPGSLAIITASFRPDERGRAIGIWAAASGIGAAVGPLFGGALIDALSWRWIFLINLPLAVATLLMTYRAVPESRDETSEKKLDFAGGISAAIGLGGATYALIESPTLGLYDQKVMIAAGLGLVGLITFFIVERRGAHPMVPMSIFRNMTFSGVNAATLFIYFAINAAFFYLILGMQQIHHYSALAAGSAILPITVILLLGSSTVGKISDKVGPRLPMTIGSLICALGLLVAAFRGGTANYWTSIFPVVMIFGIGLTLIVAPLTTAVLSALEERRAGVASGINNAVARLAGLLAFAILPAISLAPFTTSLKAGLMDLPLTGDQRTAIVAAADAQGGLEPPADISPALRHRVGDVVESAFLDGYTRAMLLAAILVALGGLISFATVRKPKQKVTTEVASPCGTGQPCVMAEPANA